MMNRWCLENFLQFKSLGRVRDIRDQLAALCERVEVVIGSNPNPGDIVPIQKAICSGYFFNTARIQKDGGYRTTKTNQTVYIHPQSALFQTQPPPRFILYYELVLTSKEFMRQCMSIEGSWLLERECCLILRMILSESLMEFAFCFSVAPHAFSKDQVDLSSHTKKMPKVRQHAAIGPAE
jgi:pre-mRNA-splicing factor ATP-dependent RNA helicase DHX16